MNIHYFIVAVQFGFGCVVQAQDYDNQKGLLVGSFDPDKSVHGVSGKLYAIDQSTLYLEHFNYDGKGPDAYFWIGKDTALPDDNGVILPHSNNKSAILTAQSDMTYILTLPDGFVVDDLKYLSVWCRQFSADFGHVVFPTRFRAPHPADINTFPLNSAHGVSASGITLLDNKRIRIEQFSYDGLAPDAFFMVGTGAVIANGVIIPNEMGSLEKLSKYEKKNIVIMLPGDLYIGDFDWFSVYCKQARTSFGDVTIPPGIVVPPYIDMGYYGAEIGELTSYGHGVRGHVYVIDRMTIWVRMFSYDGRGKNAHFYIGVKGRHGSTPNANGVSIANEKGSMDKLGAYDRQNVVLTLPTNILVTDVIWLSVFDKESNMDFGSIQFPASGINVPEEVNIGQLNGKAHGIRSGDVIIVNKRQIRISDMYYDGQGPDVFFLVGRGDTVTSGAGVKIPDEKGSFKKLGRYNGETITLTLPHSMTVDDVDWISVYCIAYTENFGDVRLPQAMYHVPPYIEPEMSKSLPNCESLDEYFNVAWNIDGSEIEFEFTGIIDVNNGYMAFGISGETTQSSMIGADVMVAYLDNGMVKIQDYSINQYSLCSGGNGVCPDEERRGTDNLKMVSNSLQNGVTSVRFRRPLAAADATLDKTIPTDAAVYIVWAIGNVNSDMMVTKHKKTLTNRQAKIEFGRAPADNCKEIMEDEEDKEDVTPWTIPKISGKNVKIFRARIGPTAGKRGYEGITGQVSWGIAWYINGYLIPELIVKRGDTYTFKVEGGDDPSNQAQYHPLYITDDPKGGYSSKDEDQKKGIRIFAGVTRNSSGVYGTDGRYCEYTSAEDPAKYRTFEAFSKTLVLKCDANKQAGQFTWTVSMDTPDLVYYQCFTHNYLGWKIHVVDNYPESVTTSGARSHVTSSGGYFLAIVALYMALLYTRL